MPDEQVQEIPKKKKKEQDRSLSFEVGKVFSVGEAKEEDLKIEPDIARYKAQQGQAGDRRNPDSEDNNYKSEDEKF